MAKATVRRNVELNEDDVKWFYETYSGLTNAASLSWVLSLMLSEFRKAHDKTPAELAAIGAQELKKLLEGGQ